MASKRLRKVSDLRGDEHNPRKITDDAFDGLKTSIEEFGNIAGITFNERTGKLIAGHQRLKALCELYGDALKFEDEAIITPTGERFGVRFVDWDDQKAIAANITANNPHIEGEFTNGLLPLLQELKSDGVANFAELQLERLLADVEPPEALGTEEDQSVLSEKKHVKCPECGHEFEP